MKIQFDDCTNLDSWVHRWDARFKVIGLVGLMMAFAAVKSLWLLPWMVLIVGTLYRLSRLPFSFLKTRLRYPGLFLVGIILFIPWFSGETPLWQWGPLTLWQEGILSSLLIAVRFLCSVTLGFIVLGTTPFLTLVNALGSLGVPALLTDMMLLSYRYLFEILANLDRMRRAMMLRGFQVIPSSSRCDERSCGERMSGRTPGRSPLLSSAPSSRRVAYERSLTNRVTILATLAGTLFIRSYEQAERVYQAMRLRGYGYRPHRFQAAGEAAGFNTDMDNSGDGLFRGLWSVYLWDAIALCLSLFIAGSLLVANYWLNHNSVVLS